MTWGNLSAKSSNLVILLPVVLRTFSKEDIVVWYLYFTIVSLQLLIDFGFLPTFTRLFSYAYSGLNIEAIQNIKNSQNANGKVDWISLVHIFVATKKIYIRISIISFLLAITFGSWLVYEPIMHSTNVFESWIGWIFVICIASFNLYANSYVAFLQGINKVALVQRWQMITSMLAVFSSTFIILLSKSLMAGIIAYYIWFIINFLINYILYKQYIKMQNIDIDNNKIHNLIKKTIWPTAWRSGLGISMSMGLIQLSGMIVAKIESSSIAASYMIALQMIRAISSFSQAPFYSKLPYFTQLYAKKDIITLIGMSKNRMQKSFFVFIGMFLFIGLFANDFLRILHSNVQFPNSNMWILIGCTFLFERYGVMYLQLYTLTNHIIWHIANGITGLLMIVLVFLLYHHFDIYAFPLAMSIAYIVFFTPYVIKKVYGEYNLNFIEQEKTNFLLAILLFCISAVIIKLKDIL
jgi:hypothetical protein